MGQEGWTDRPNGVIQRLPFSVIFERYRADVQKLNEEILELDEVLYGMEKEVEVRLVGCRVSCLDCCGLACVCLSPDR